MLYTYICYWKTFQCKSIIPIIFHVIKQSHAGVTSKDICLLFTLFVFSIDILLHIHLSNIKILSPGTNILGVPGKNIKKKNLINKLTKNN